jgi:hypothetical protein
MSAAKKDAEYMMKNCHEPGTSRPADRDVQAMRARQMIEYCAGSTSNAGIKASLGSHAVKVSNHLSAPANVGGGGIHASVPKKK